MCCDDKVYISPNSLFLSDRFVYKEIEELVERNRTPIVEKNSFITVVRLDSKTRKYEVHVMKVGDRIEPFCIEMVRINELTKDDEYLVRMAIDRERMQR